MRVNSILKIENLTVRYGRAEALRGIRIHIASGQMVSLIGANGAGKSTMLKAITGLVRPFRGEIHFEGRRIDGIQPQVGVRLGLALVPEGRQVFPEMTVLENLEMGAYLRKGQKEITLSLESIYTLFPILKNRKSQWAGSLSGGEQQMLAVGRALMTNPKLLLVDELSLGLAPIVVKDLSKTVVRINREKKVTVLLVEQNAKLALSLTDYTYVLETGKISLEGKAGELLQNEDVRRAYLGG